jgi:YHS domain-containing protein
MLHVSRRQIIVCALSVGIPAAALSDPRLALGGYDPVSYFSVGHPDKGLPEFTATFDDATYYFTNAEHRALFVANPEQYAPQFQGFCTIDLSRGLKTEPDPEAWSIVDGKLYVFGKKRGPGVFAQDSSAILKNVAEKWPELRK